LDDNQRLQLVKDYDSHFQLALINYLTEQGDTALALWMLDVITQVSTFLLPENLTERELKPIIITFINLKAPNAPESIRQHPLLQNYAANYKLAELSIAAFEGKASQNELNSYLESLLEQIKPFLSRKQKRRLDKLFTSLTSEAS
jgi:hypothetical protein